MAKHNQPDKLSQDASAALAAGMTYGKYMAMKEPMKVAMPKERGIRHICEYCGKEFMQYDRLHRKYCCEEHRKAAGNRYVPKKQSTEQTDKICPVCGKHFMPATWRNKYCGEFCAKLAHIESVRNWQQKKAQRG